MDIKQKRQRFNILLHYGQMQDAKEHILGAYGATSTTQLTDRQIDDAINRVQHIINEKNRQKDAEVRKWRHNCLRMIKECGIDTNNWNEVNEFVMNPRIAGKHIYEMSIDELKTLQRKLHNVVENIKNKQQEINRLQTQN